MGKFQRAAEIQARVVGALMLRDFVSSADHGALGLFGLIAKPGMIIAGIFITEKLGKAISPHGFPLLIFSISGYLTWLAFLRTYTSISIEGEVKRLLMFPHITPLDLIAARMAVEFVVYTVVFICFALLGTLFDQAPPPADPFGVIMAFWSALSLGVFFGLFTACVRRFTTLLDDFFIIIRYLGFIISGVFVLAADTPYEILRYLDWNPLYHCVEWLRESWWAPYKSPIADPGYVFSCIFFLAAVGLSFERATRKWERE